MHAPKQEEAEKDEKRKTEKDLENENGGAGVYSMNLKKKHNILANDHEWKEDTMPEILDVHNVFDFIDPDILHRVEELEREDCDFEIDGNELTPEQQEALALIRKKKSLLIQHHRMKKSTAESRPIVPTQTIKRMRGMPASRRGRKRERSVADIGEDGMDIDGDLPSKKQRLSGSRSVARRLSSEVVLGEGFRDSSQKAKAIKLARKSVRKRNKDARRGEADRVIPNMKPEHVFWEAIHWKNSQTLK